MQRAILLARTCNFPVSSAGLNYRFVFPDSRYELASSSRKRHLPQPVLPTFFDPINGALHEFGGTVGAAKLGRYRLASVQCGRSPSLMPVRFDR